MVFLITEHRQLGYVAKCGEFERHSQNVNLLKNKVLNYLKKIRQNENHDVIFKIKKKKESLQISKTNNII
jgi:hypothetical protein